METYSKKELAEFAKGVFADDRKAVAYYADARGNFKNELQYETLKDEEKKAFTRFENPELSDSDETRIIVLGSVMTVEEVEAVISALQSKNFDVVAELDGRIKELNIRIEEINTLAGKLEDFEKSCKKLSDELESVTTSLATAEENGLSKDAEIADLKERLKAKGIADSEQVETQLKVTEVKADEVKASADKKKGGKSKTD